MFCIHCIKPKLEKICRECGNYTFPQLQQFKQITQRVEESFTTDSESSSDSCESESCDLTLELFPPKGLLELWEYVSNISFFQKKFNGRTEIYTFKKVNDIFSGLISCGFDINTNYLRYKSPAL